ncbi:hypothetical protein MSBR3_1677 [Methanosarcina barkeri 3]|uniref:Uncharacterized protein n=1 Tax=Methanosarcina barkeri 3 TaxID=1434107 RepID=A0A0E3WWK1_METBA|nr:hypothetical protein MSBR3_1677 [Methanosarcina barkeri 3]
MLSGISAEKKLFYNEQIPKLLSFIYTRLSADVFKKTIIFLLSVLENFSKSPVTISTEVLENLAESFH